MPIVDGAGALAETAMDETPDAGAAANARNAAVAAALRGDTAKGLFFRGRGELPFGAQIASGRQLLERLLTPGVALGTPA